MRILGRISTLRDLGSSLEADPPSQRDPWCVHGIQVGSGVMISGVSEEGAANSFQANDVSISPEDTRDRARQRLRRLRSDEDSGKTQNPISRSGRISRKDADEQERCETCKTRPSTVWCRTVASFWPRFQAKEDGQSS